MHVGLIMDGNGRWATRNGFDRIEGHRNGAKVVEEIIKSCSQAGVKTLTLYAFSTENWLRAKDEIKGLMDLFDYYISNNLAQMISQTYERNSNVQAKATNCQDNQHLQPIYASASPVQ